MVRLRERLIIAILCLVLVSPLLAESGATVAVPHTSFPVLYTLHAGDAAIQFNKKNDILVLYDVYPIMGRSLKTMSHMEHVTDFLHEWKKIKNKPVEADVTGVMVDHRSIGHAQFYETVWLSDPDYESQTNEMRFRLTWAYPESKGASLLKRIVIHSAVVFINGEDFI